VGTTFTLCHGCEAATALSGFAMRLRFLTSTPLNIREGSGTYAGIRTLADALKKLGVAVEIASPSLHVPVYTAERLLFNRMLKPPAGFDATVGFDMDGYRLAGRGGAPHIASIKGVIADELSFQKGATRVTMAIQARCERLHARRADRVITTSNYAAGRIRNLYGVSAAVVPELIDLEAWSAWLAANPAPPDPARFTVLCVCRLYRRKRVDVLLRAAARLRGRLPGLQVRIVGDGPEREEFRSVWREERLGDSVRWLGDVPRAALAAEYNRCDVFCLPSVQEGFGIVFLEAMAAGKPIVAARAAAAPEVVPHAAFAEPDDAGSLAEVLVGLWRDPARRASLAAASRRRVPEFDAPRVARAFLVELTAAAVRM
jgi:glycosyltransferase involved in cell wall biosynthesis